MANPVKIKATVTEVVKHTEGVVSYSFKPQGRVPKFRAGQFLHLALDEYHTETQWPESRVFSIASSPSKRRDQLQITISAKGAYTQRICDTLEVGSECWLKLPYGEFLFPANKHLTLIAGGVGITPYLSFLEQMVENFSEQPVHLYYGVRSAEHYLFSDLIDECERVLSNFSKSIYCEDGSVACRIGILDIKSIHAEAPEGSLFYLSGPPLMIESFKGSLAERSVKMDCILVDDWE